MKPKTTKVNLCKSCELNFADCPSSNVKFGENDDNVISCDSFTKKNYETPIEEILLRSSSIGILAAGVVKKDLTEPQRAELEGLLLKKVTPIGLSEKQQAKLDSYDKRVKNKETLTQGQMAEREDFRKRLTAPKGITPNQEERLQYLIDKDGAEPELSQGAKTHIKDVWLWHEKGFREDITSKHIRKGEQGEEDAVKLISIVDDRMYHNNNKLPDRGRKTKGHLTGACDVNTYFEEIEKTIIDDCKCSWNPKTFMSATLTPLYEWQGRAYMYLYDADIFRLRYCLVDCPPDVYADELKRFCWNNNIIDEELEEYRPLIEQFDRNFLYEHSGRYGQEERVKTFAITRDEELEKVLLKAIELGIEYYKTITLNMIE